MAFNDYLRFGTNVISNIARGKNPLTASAMSLPPLVKSQTPSGFEPLNPEAQVVRSGRIGASTTAPIQRAPAPVQAPAPRPAPAYTPPPVSTPPLQAPGGFQTQLNPLDPAAIGGAQMRPPTPVAPPVPPPVPPAPSYTPPSPIQPPQPQAPQQDQMTAYEKAILEAMKPRESETALAEQLAGLSEEQAKIQELEQKDLGAIRDRATLLPFLTGQSARLQQNVQGMLQGVASRALPLKERLAMEQAQRQASLESAQTARGFEKERRDAEEAKRKDAEVTPIEVGGRLVNPKTGQIIYEPPSETESKSYTLSPGQKVYDAQGNIIASNDSASDKLTSVSPGSTIIDANGNVVYRAPEKGEVSAGDANARATETLQNKLNLIDGLITSPGMGGSVGAYGISRFTPFTADKAERQNFAAGVMQLISQDTLDTLLNLKAQGGTLGALSDQERQTLQSAATKIGSWIQRDKNGNPTGKFEISESFFKDELNKLRTLTQSALERAQGTQAMPGVGASGTIEDPNAFLDSF